MAGKRIDEGVRQQVRDAHEKGLARKKIAEQFGISPSSVSRIVKEGASGQRAPQAKKAPSSPEGAERQKRIREIERRIAELERKIQYWDAKRRA